ncbi:MAG: hypothetical protein V3W34_16490 [Phycisphaerae bacterium]
MRSRAEGRGRDGGTEGRRDGGTEGRRDEGTKGDPQSPIVNRQSSIVNRQSSIVNRQSSIVNSPMGPLFPSSRSLTVAARIQPLSGCGIP